MMEDCGGKIEEECVLMICYINHLMMHDGVDLFAFGLLVYAIS